MFKFHMFAEVRAKPKERPRMGKNGVFTPKKTSDYEKAISSLAQYHMNLGFLTATDKPITLDVAVTFKVPKGLSKKKREELTGTPHTHRPDADNLYKAVADALNGVVYLDDSQIYRGRFSKTYGAIDSLDITVTEYAP